MLLDWNNQKYVPSQRDFSLRKAVSTSILQQSQMLQPFVDSKGLLRVGDRLEMSQSISYEAQHPLILYEKHLLTYLIVHTEHIRLLHAGLTFLSATLATRYHIVKGHKTIRSIYCQCITCCRHLVKPKAQIMDQL